MWCIIDHKINSVLVETGPLSEKQQLRMNLLKFKKTFHLVYNAKRFCARRYSNAQ